MLPHVKWMTLNPEEPRLRGVSKGEATSRAFILRDARSALPATTASPLRRDEELTSPTVIASAAKQSRIFPRRDSGLLRCARNDEMGHARTTPSLSSPALCALAHWSGRSVFQR